MSVDMFTSLNNDILQCILYEWLDIQDICQLDIAVCNHSVRPLYYEALQSSTLPLLQSSIDDLFGEVSEKKLFDLIKWSKIRGIKNPIETIHLRQIENDDHDNEILTSERIYELSNDLKPFKYIKSLSLGYCNSNLLYAFGSLKSLTYLQLSKLKIVSNDICLLGFFFKQLTSLETISINFSFDPVVLSILLEMPSLKHLLFGGFAFSDSFKYNLSKFTQLESLLLCNYTKNKLLDLSYLTTLTNLKELTLASSIISLQHILSLNQIKTLELNCVDIMETNNINFEDYLSIHQLESIKIYNTAIDQDIIQFILQSKQLKTLKIQNCFLLQSSLFYDINNLSNLIHLSLSKVNIDKQLFDNICQLSLLKGLQIRGKSNQNNKQNICLSFSKLSKQLTSLDFTYQPYIINKNTFEEISQLQNIKYLSIDWNLDSLEDIQPLSQLKQLSNLTCTNETIYNSYSNKQLKKKIKETLQNSDLYVWL